LDRFAQVFQQFGPCCAVIAQERSPC
jgi:hypothetical protein